MEMMVEHYRVTEVNWFEATAKELRFAVSETPRFVGRAVATSVADAARGRWNSQSLSSGQLARVYSFTNMDGFQPDVWATWRWRIEANPLTLRATDDGRQRAAQSS